jgi:Flp pilus assembly pilin Flp
VQTPYGGTQFPQATSATAELVNEPMDDKDTGPMITRFIHALSALHDDKRAVTIIEYTLLAALIGLALVASLSGLEGKIATAFTSIGNGV